jgi:hypothetical protein
MEDSLFEKLRKPKLRGFRFGVPGSTLPLAKKRLV